MCRIALAESPDLSQTSGQTGANDGESQFSSDLAAPQGDAEGDPGTDGSGADASGEGADQPADVVLVDVSPELRVLDLESPQVVSYLGHGLCLGALLGVVFSTTIVSGNWGGSSRE